MSLKIDNENIVYSCKNILINEYLKRNNCNYSLELMDIIDLTIVPEVIIDGKRIGKSRKYLNGLLNGDDFCNNYGVDLQYIEYENYYIGKKAIVNKLVCNDLIIVSGTQYNLKYSKWYMNDKYFSEYGKGAFGICNHWIGLYEWKDGLYKYYDPTYNANGYLKEAEFEKFWWGDKQFDLIKNSTSELLSFGELVISIDRDKNLQEKKRQSSLRKCIELYLYVGDSGESVIGLNIYKRIMKLLLDREVLSLQFLYNFFFEQKRNFYILRNALNYYNLLSDSVCVYINRVVEYHEELCMLLYMDILRCREMKNRTNVYVEKIRGLVDEIEKLMTMLLENVIEDEG